MNKVQRNKQSDNINRNVITNNRTFPVNSKLYLKLLIDFWKNEILSNKVYGEMYSAKVEELLAQAPELSEPIIDLKILDKHRELIQLLMTVIFPPAGLDTDIAAAYIPFTKDTIYATPTYRRLFDYIEECNEEKKTLDDQKMYLVIMLHAYKAILNHFYDFNIEFDFPMIINYTDRQTGFDRFYNIDIDPRFTEIINLKTIKPPTYKEKKRLHDNLTDLDVWQEIIPIENFEFRGFAIYRATDVTDNELLSQLKYEMSKKTTFNTFQQKLRSLLRVSDLKAGISGISGIIGQMDLIRNCSHSAGNGLLLRLLSGKLSKIHLRETDAEPGTGDCSGS